MYEPVSKIKTVLRNYNTLQSLSSVINCCCLPFLETLAVDAVYQIRFRKSK